MLFDICSLGMLEASSVMPDIAIAPRNPATGCAVIAESSLGFSLVASSVSCSRILRISSSASCLIWRILCMSSSGMPPYNCCSLSALKNAETQCVSLPRMFSGLCSFCCFLGFAGATFAGAFFCAASILGVSVNLNSDQPAMRNTSVQSRAMSVQLIIHDI